MSLQDRLRKIHDEAGGEAGLREILRDFYRRMASDVMVGFFFEGRDLDAIAEKQLEFLLKAMGARASYSGRPPAQAHLQLPPILAGHFDRRLILLREVLLAHGLSGESQEAWLEFEGAFRGAIVK